MAGNPLERLVHVSLQIWTSSLTVLTLYFTDFNDNGSQICVWLEIERPTHFRMKSISCMYFSNPVKWVVSFLSRKTTVYTHEPRV